MKRISQERQCIDYEETTILIGKQNIARIIIIVNRKRNVTKDII